MFTTLIKSFGPYELSCSQSNRNERLQWYEIWRLHQGVHSRTGGIMNHMYQDMNTYNAFLKINVTHNGK